MPYKFKGKKDCTQSDGSKGKYKTVKKGGSTRCYKSKKQYDAAMAWAHESDVADDELIVSEENLREMIRDQLRFSISEIKKKNNLIEIAALLVKSIKDNSQ